jgi:hypothetical protein
MSVPTTAISSNFVLVSWSLPDTRGSPITGYTIKIRESDDLTFTHSIADCNGSTSTIISSRSCLIPISTLRSAPFNLPWGSSVFAKVSATNLYGTSDESLQGNGAVILTVPDAPRSVQDDPLVTSGTQIAL